MDYAIDLTVVKDFKVKGKRFGEYWVDGNEIAYQIPYPFPCKFKVVDLKHIVATPMMMRLPTFLKWHNVDWLRQQLQQVSCVGNDSVVLHGAAWQKDGVGYLAVGFANSGKTTRILQEVSNGANFCADENVVVTRDLEIFQIPRLSFINRWHINMFGIKISRWQRLKLRLAEFRALCPLFEPNIWVKFPWPSRHFKLDKIVMLTPSEHASLRLLTDNEFPFITNPVLQTYAYATGWDLYGVYEKYKEILSVIDSCPKLQGRAPIGDDRPPPYDVSRGRTCCR